MPSWEVVILASRAVVSRTCWPDRDQRTAGITVGGLRYSFLLRLFRNNHAEAELSVSVGETRQALKDIFSSRYLRFFFFMVLLGQIVSNLIDLAYTQWVNLRHDRRAYEIHCGFTAVLSSFSVAMLWPPRSFTA